MRRIAFIAGLAALVWGCSEAPPTSTPLDGESDSLSTDTSVDSGPTVPPERANVPIPSDTLMAGVGERDLRFPIGAGTVGYSPGGGANTPWSGMYPGTDAQHTELTARALVLRRQGETVALVRTATIGIWQDMVEDIRRRLREEGRADLAEGLIVTATHTHSSGGRVFDHPIGEIAVGTFLPAFYLRMRDAIAEAVLAADEASIPARVGHTTIQVPELHSDRRCENGDNQDDSLGLLKVEDLNGELLALGVSYAMHGTTLGTGDWTLSSDAPGAVETGIEARLPSPAPVLYLQSWAGDMAPNMPEGYATVAGDDLRPGFTELDGIGAAAADAVIPALADIPTTDAPTLKTVSARVPLSATEINPDGSFDDYPWGGLYCVNSDQNCEPDATPYSEADLACLPFDESF
ncbi:MAG: neutral/alkaline non-lysosomal ceramidase N-terminal domain-containing protein, partial [Myxococcota bacterium]|nr:neutral/alkaline non-lysosomal ceramidase N-terminal domain-containing protein [Myxococcota bacterium]